MICAGGDVSVEIPEGTDGVVAFYLVGNDGQILESISDILQGVTYKVSTDSVGDTEIFTKRFPGEITIETMEVKANFRCKTVEVIQIPIFDTDITNASPNTYYQECQITDTGNFTTTIFASNSFKITQSSIS